MIAGIVAGLVGWLLVSAAAARVLARWLAQQLPVDLTAPPRPVPSDAEIAAHIEQLLDEIRKETA